MKILLIAPVFLLAACGTDGVAEPESGTPDGTFKQITIQVASKPLKCVTMQQSAGNSVWGGLSCDWVEYHRAQ